MKKTIISFLSLLFLTSTAWAGHFTEDFTTETYKNSILTSAVWDTAAGQLRVQPFSMSDRGRWASPGNTQAATLNGNHLYVIDLSAGLRVLDISDPITPVEVGSYYTSGNWFDVKISGHHAFIGAGSNLVVVDISDPTNPTFVASTPVEDRAEGLTVSGNFVYVADSSEGLTPVNIDDPSDPIKGVTIPIGGSAHAVTTNGDFVYLAAKADGVKIFEISNPGFPTLLGSYSGTIAWDLAIYGAFLYVADYSGGLMILDVSDPTTPTLVSSLSLGGNPTGIEVSGNEVFLSDLGSDLHMVDVSDPANPFLIDSIATDGEANDVAVAHDMAYIADGTEGIQIVHTRHVNDLVALDAVGSYSDQVKAHGDFVFSVGLGSIRVGIIDISDPGNPRQVNTLMIGSQAYGTIDIEGNTLYVVGWAPNQIGVFDLTNLPSVASLGSPINTTDVVQDIDVVGDLLYAVTEAGDIRVYDVSDPASISEIDRYTPGGMDPTHLKVDGDIAFVTARYPHTLRILDVTNPSTITQLSQYNLDGLPWDIEVMEHYVLVAQGTNGVKILDVSDLNAPSLVTSISPSLDDIHSVDVDGNRAIFTGAQYVQLYNFSNPASPSGEVLTVLTASFDAEIVGGMVYVANGSDGMRPVIVSQPFLDMDENRGRSLFFHGGTEPIRKVSLTATGTGQAEFWLATAAFYSYRSVPGDGTWVEATDQGPDLSWETQLDLSAHPATEAPTLSQLDIRWAYDAPDLVRIEDEPNDQGGELRVFCERAASDFSGEATQASHYYLWRRIDNETMKARTLEEGTTVTSWARDELDQTRWPEEAEHLKVGDCDYLYVPAAAGQFPPGLWQAITGFPALQQDQYVSLASSLGDSTDTGITYTTLCASVHTNDPDIWFVSEPDSSYSVDNIFPEVPSGLAADYNHDGSGNDLDWDPSDDDDFQYFKVYRGFIPDFPVDRANPYHQTIDHQWTDASGTTAYFYKVSAVDDAGNESLATEPETVTAAPDTPIERYALQSAIPNPFNPATQIEYRVPEGGGKIRLVIYDVQGREVKVLVDRKVNGGVHTVAWKGEDMKGRSVVSGIYYCRLQAPGFVQTHKLALVR